MIILKTVSAFACSVLAFMCMTVTIVGLTRLDCNSESGLICHDSWLVHFSQTLLLRPTLLFVASAIALNALRVWRVKWWATLLWSVLAGSTFYFLNLSLWGLEARDGDIFGWLMVLFALLISVVIGSLFARWPPTATRSRGP
jgi:hypothetical protein